MSSTRTCSESSPLGGLREVRGQSKAVVSGSGLYARGSTSASAARQASTSSALL